MSSLMNKTAIGLGLWEIRGEKSYSPISSRESQTWNKVNTTLAALRILDRNIVWPDPEGIEKIFQAINTVWDELYSRHPKTGFMHAADLMGLDVTQSKENEPSIYIPCGHIKEAEEHDENDPGRFVHMRIHLIRPEGGVLIYD